MTASQPTSPRAPQWEPGTLSSTDLDRVLIDALADLWADCWRRDQARPEQMAMFVERMARAVKCATGSHGTVRRTA